jgi:hypothetical protein
MAAVLCKPGENHFAQSRVGDCVDDERPLMDVRECLAFYRILFGHHDLIVSRERQVSFGVGVVIGKSVRHAGHPEPAQLFKKTLRVTDAGDGMYAPVFEMSGFDNVLRVLQVTEFVAV